MWDIFSYPILIHLHDSSYIAILVVITIAFIGDGIETIIRIRAFTSHNAVLSKFREELKSKNSTYHQEFTFILTVYKNGNELKRCINSLLEQGIPRDKILVVDDFSNDEFHTAETAAEFGVKVISISRNSKKIGAVKFAIDNILTKYVILMDSDCVLLANHDRLQQAFMEMELFGLDAMAVKVLPCLPATNDEKLHEYSQNGNLLLELQCLEYEQAMRLGRGATYAIEAQDNNYRLKYAEVPCISGAFGIFRETILKQVMTSFPYKEDVFDGEDFERTLKILALKGNVGYAEDIVVLTSIPVSIVTHFKQRDHWSAGTIRCFISKFGAATLKRKISGLVYVTYLIRDILLHPLKIYYLPMLVLFPICFLSMMSFYYILNIFIVKKINSNVTSTKAIFLFPVYRLYLLFPVTIGYLRWTFYIISQIYRKRAHPYPKLKIIKRWNYVKD